LQQSRIRGLLLVAALAVAFLTRVTGVSAHPPPYPAYSVTLEDDHGNPLRTFRRNGTTFVLGYLGEKYEVRLSNHTARRVEAVLSVDGRDAVSGDPGDFASARGYVVPPFGSVVVDGFRQSLEETAVFRFSRPASSYSSRMGTPENVGVIGVAFFSERVQRVAPAPYRRYHYQYDFDDAPRADESSDGAGASRAAPTAPRDHEPRSEDAPRRARKSGLGTEYGESTYSPVTEVPFQRQNSSHPDVVTSLRYDDARGLIARGIDVYPHAPPAVTAWPEPDPFPASHFAPPP
jgi:hypothetical protein